jgi:hypothetical protein
MSKELKQAFDMVIPFAGVLFFNQVPFIDNYYNAFGCLLNISADMQVLGGCRFGGIKNEESDIGSVNGPQSSYYAVLFNSRFNTL